MPPETTFIYALLDPRGNVRYIGKSDNPQRRYQAHIKTKGDTYLDRWIHKLQRAGWNPALRVIMECPYEIWQKMEKHWIATFRWIGIELFNLHKGGQGGSLKGRKFSTQAKINIGISRRGKKNGFYGRQHTKETRRKISRANSDNIPWNKGKINIYSDETKEKIRSSLLGKKHTPEAKLKMSKARCGKKLSRSHRAAISKGLKGRIPWNKGKKSNKGYK